SFFEKYFELSPIKNTYQVCRVDNCLRSKTILLYFSIKIQFLKKTYHNYLTRKK
ncbi:unnamed protein product, partial [marine sediment metagenome]